MSKLTQELNWTWTTKPYKEKQEPAALTEKENTKVHTANIRWNVTNVLKFYSGPLSINKKKKLNLIWL